MNYLNTTLTEKAKFFMDIAYLSDGSYMNKIKNKKIQFIPQDKTQEIQYEEQVINENSFFSEA